MRLIIPLVIEQFLAIFIGMADTIMVSSVSESAISAVSLVDSINVLLIQLFSAMATGGAVVAAQYLGMRDQKNACKAAKQLMYVALAIALVIGALSAVFCRPILRLCFGGLNERTMAYCETYFYLSAASYPALALYNGGAALMRAMGNSRSSMFTSLLMNVANIVGNAILIYGFGLEVLGAGVASFFSRVLAAVIMLKLLAHRDSPIYLEKISRPQPDWFMIKRILRQGVPNGLENSMFQVGKLMVTGIVALFAESMIAANAVCNNIGTFINLPGNSVCLAMITVVGQCVGAGDKEQAKYYAKKLVMITMAFMAVTNGLLFCFPGQLASVFSLSPEGVAASESILRVYAVMAALFWTLSFTLPAALRAAGDSRFTMLVAIISMWTLRIGLSYYFVYVMDMGLLGVWMAMYLDWVARAILFSRRYRSGKWLEQKVL